MSIFQKKSQIEKTPFINSKLKEWGIEKVNNIEDLLNIRRQMYRDIEFLPYNDETREIEKEIRWKRTGSEVLEDGYVYQGKFCTDIVVTFITLVKAAGVKDTRFVKVKNPETNTVHSLAEVKLSNSWYIFDVSNRDSLPLKGQITKENPFGKYLLWKKGRDSWDLGLDEFNTIQKIQV